VFIRSVISRPGADACGDCRRAATAPPAIRGSRTAAWTTATCPARWGFPKARRGCIRSRSTAQTTRFAPLCYALTSAQCEARMQLILAVPQQKLVGMRVVGDGTGTGTGTGTGKTLQGFAVAVRTGATLKDLQNTVAIHPTYAEEFVTIK
jgi:hypothetical protein